MRLKRRCGARASKQSPTGGGRLMKCAVCIKYFAILTILFLISRPLAPAQNPAQNSDAVKERYTKSEFLIPMRDGVRLFSVVYTPKDASQPYPFLLTRTPYSVAPYGVDNYRASLGPSEHFEKEGFIFVYQDARGRYMSEGEFQQVRPYHPNKRGPKEIDESTDTYDTIEWLLKNIPNNNGKAGMIGILAARLATGRRSLTIRIMTNSGASVRCGNS